MRRWLSLLSSVFHPLGTVCILQALKHTLEFTYPTIASMLKMNIEPAGDFQNAAASEKKKKKKNKADRTIGVTSIGTKKKGN